MRIALAWAAPQIILPGLCFSGYWRIERAARAPLGFMFGASPCTGLFRQSINRADRAAGKNAWPRDKTPPRSYWRASRTGGTPAHFLGVPNLPCAFHGRSVAK